MSRLEEINASIGYWDSARRSCAPKKALYATLFTGVMEELLGMAEEAEKLRGRLKEIKEVLGPSPRDGSICVTICIRPVLDLFRKWDREDREQKETKDGAGKDSDST